MSEREEEHMQIVIDRISNTTEEIYTGDGQIVSVQSNNEYNIDFTLLLDGHAIDCDLDIECDGDLSFEGAKELIEDMLTKNVKGSVD